MNVSEAFTPVWAQSGCQHVRVVSNVKGSTHKITRSEGFGLCIGFALCSNFVLFVLGGLGLSYQASWNVWRKVIDGELSLYFQKTNFSPLAFC